MTKKHSDKLKKQIIKLYNIGSFKIEKNYTLQQNKLLKFQKKVAIVSLILYTILLINVVLLSRNAMYLADEDFMTFAKLTINIVPFEFVENFIYQYQLGIISTFILVREIIGNFVLLMPLSILLPIINKRFLQTKEMVITVCLVSITIELTQLFTRRGICNIDDLLLNTCGALLCYGVVKKVLKKLTFY